MRKSHAFIPVIFEPCLTSRVDKTYTTAIVIYIYIHIYYVYMYVCVQYKATFPLLSSNFAFLGTPISTPSLGLCFLPGCKSSVGTGKTSRKKKQHTRPWMTGERFYKFVKLLPKLSQILVEISKTQCSCCIFSVSWAMQH